jgi:hypothetical protein
MQQHQQEFDTRPLADGLHDLAGQAADAPGLFDAVAAGARRRSARVRRSGAVLAVGGVLGIAAGVAAWPSGSGAHEATLQSSVTSISTLHCPADPPGDSSLSDTGASKPLIVGTPVAATLCVYGFDNSGTTVRTERITGSDLRALTNDLAHGKSSTSAACTLEKRNPMHRLILQYADGSKQDLAIDMSGCGRVGTGTRSVLLPTELRQRITS